MFTILLRVRLFHNLLLDAFMVKIRFLF